MPGLIVTIGANAAPMDKEFSRAAGLSKKLAQDIRANLEHGGELRSGVVREAVVLLRELSAGNWTRVPGSLSLLLQRMGALKVLFTDITAAGSTLGGVISIMGTALAGAAVGAGIFYSRVKLLSEALQNIKPADFNPTYIAKHLQSINAAVEGQKAINREIARSIELYNSASNRADRVEEATRMKYDHMRKMNELEIDPVKKAQVELSILREEQRERQRNSATNIANLAIESQSKKRDADLIKVASKEQDANEVAAKAAQAKQAEDFLKSHNMFGSNWDKAKATFSGGLLPGAAQSAYDAMGNADRQRVQDSQDSIQAHREAIDRAAENEEKRKRKEQLQKDAEESAAKSAVLQLEAQRRAAADAKELKNATEFVNAELNRGGKIGNNVNALQKVGGYLGGASDQHLAVQKMSLAHLASIDRKIGGSGRVQH